MPAPRSFVLSIVSIVVALGVAGCGGDSENASGSPSRNASATWTWSPGTELVRDAEAFKEAA